MGRGGLGSCFGIYDVWQVVSGEETADAATDVDDSEVHRQSEFAAAQGSPRPSHEGTIRGCDQDDVSILGPSPRHPSVPTPIVGDSQRPGPLLDAWLFAHSCNASPGRCRGRGKARPWWSGDAAGPSLAIPSARPRSFTWDEIEVTVALQEDGSFHVTERDRIDFRGGPFRSGYREIPLARIEAIDTIRVGELTGDGVRPYQYVRPTDFLADVPDTYTYREVGPTLRIDWSFPRTSSAMRTFQIASAAAGRPHILKR